MAKKILIVDDDQALLDLLKAYLSGKDYEVETALDGEEGFEKVKNWKPRLVILDVMMPKMDGYTFIRELKKSPHSKGVSVIVLTAREMMREMFAQEGVRDYLVKPFQPEELLEVIAKYF